MVAVTVTEPKSAATHQTVPVAPGTLIALTADQGGGKWRHNGNQLADADAPVHVSQDTQTLTIVMDAAGKVAGKYDYVVNDKVSNQITIEKLQSLSSRVAASLVPLVLSTILFGLGSFLLLYAGDNPGSGESKLRAYGFALLTLLYVLLLLWLAGRASNDHRGLSYLIQGVDRRASTSKLQYVLWTFGVGFALAYIAARATLSETATFACTQDVTKNCVPAENWDAYLVLLGVPAATAVLAKGITASKVTDGTVQKTEAEAAKPADVVTNDNGQADLADVQYLLFNVIAFAYVTVHFIKNGVLVDVPAILLGLTSAAAAAYVGNKSLQNDKPVIASVTPTVVAAGTAVTIRGHHLFPPGAPDHVHVTIGGVGTTGQRSGRDVLIPEAPAGMSNSDNSVTVTTAANVATDKYPIVVQGLTIVGSVSGPPSRNTDLVLLVEGLPPQQHDVRVTFGTLAQNATADTKGLITVAVPNEVPKGDVETRVGLNGRWSEPLTLTFT
jgi:hypothetical protein